MVIYIYIYIKKQQNASKNSNLLTFVCGNLCFFAENQYKICMIYLKLLILPTEKNIYNYEL